MLFMGKKYESFEATCKEFRVGSSPPMIDQLKAKPGRKYRILFTENSEPTKIEHERDWSIYKPLSLKEQTYDLW